jgi:hypothetical protein
MREEGVIFYECLKDIFLHKIGVVSQNKQFNPNNLNILGEK